MLAAYLRVHAEFRYARLKSPTKKSCSIPAAASSGLRISSSGQTSRFSCTTSTSSARLTSVRCFSSISDHNALATLAVQDRPTSRLSSLRRERPALRPSHRVSPGESELVRPVSAPPALAFSGIHILSPRIFALMQSETMHSPSSLRTCVSPRKMNPYSGSAQTDTTGVIWDVRSTSPMLRGTLSKAFTPINLIRIDEAQSLAAVTPLKLRALGALSVPR